MNKIEVHILEHNLYNNMPTFLAMLTQRGSKISSMDDLRLLKSKILGSPKKELICLPHTTILRMNYVTVAITGLSTKAVSQLRTHAKRCTCLSTSTQYSEYSTREDNYVYPSSDPVIDTRMADGYSKVQSVYNELIKDGVDKDIAGYLLPQGLRKAFIMHANIDDWRYMLRTRLCRRNTEEVQHICRMIYKEIADINPVWLEGCLPNCAYGPCKEGKFCCGKPIKEGEI